MKQLGRAAFVLFLVGSTTCARRGVRPPQTTEQATRPVSDATPHRDCFAPSLEADGTAITVTTKRACTFPERRTGQRTATSESVSVSCEEARCAGAMVAALVTAIPDRSAALDLSADAGEPAKVPGPDRSGWIDRGLLGEQRVDLGTTDASGVLSVDLGDAIPADLILVPDKTTATIQVEGQEVGTVDLSEVFQKRRNLAWHKVDLDTCLTPTSSLSCDSVKEFLDRYPDGKSSAQAREVLEQAQDALGKFYEAETWSRVKGDVADCISKALDEPSTIDTLCATVADYVSKFPSGAHSTEARTALKKAAARQAKLQARLDKPEQDRQAKLYSAPLDSDEDGFCSKDCRRDGRCSKIGQSCVARTVRQCQASEQCKVHGSCSLRPDILDGRCVVRSGKDCLSSQDCRDSAQCTPEPPPPDSFGSGGCVFRSTADCRASDLCKKEGRCTLVQGDCAATTDRDCKNSLNCRLESACSLNAERKDCTVPPECAGECSQKGRCKYEDGGCVAASAEDCARSENCKNLGHCQLERKGRNGFAWCIARNRSGVGLSV